MVQMIVAETLEIDVANTEGFAEYIRGSFSALAANPDSIELKSNVLQAFRKAREAIAAESAIRRELLPLRFSARYFRDQGLAGKAGIICEEIKEQEEQAERTGGKVLQDTFQESLNEHPQLRELLCGEFRKITAETSRGVDQAPAIRHMEAEEWTAATLNPEWYQEEGFYRGSAIFDPDED